MKHIFGGVVVCAALVTVAVFLCPETSAVNQEKTPVALPATETAAPKKPLSQEDLASLAKPSVVRIVQHLEGEAMIESFDVNLKDLTINPVADGQPTRIALDEYLTGSGFIINPDGYILTNSHVVSYQTIKLLIVYNAIEEAIARQAFQLSEDEQKKLLEDKDRLDEFGEKIVDYLLKGSTFEIKKTLTVLNPSSKKEKLTELVEEGFPASIISVYDDFHKDNKDAAIVKIDQRNLPAIKLGNAVPAKTGEKIYIFGFPATAEFNQKNLLESTFTQGVLSAFKDSENKDFKIYQTDAKVSQGSSGGPLLNGQGEVIGLITYQTGEMEQQSGDNFAFAIPIDKAQGIIRENYISQLSVQTSAPQAGPYYTHFRTGLNDLAEKNCTKALEEFNAAQNDINPNFLTASHIAPYVEKCNALIASGDSIDTDWDRFRDKISSTDYFIWILAGAGSVVVAALIAVIAVLATRIKKEEKEIDMLETSVDKLEHEIHDHENKR